MPEIMISTMVLGITAVGTAPLLKGLNSTTNEAGDHAKAARMAQQIVEQLSSTAVNLNDISWWCSPMMYGLPSGAPSSVGSSAPPTGVTPNTITDPQTSKVFSRYCFTEPQTCTAGAPCLVNVVVWWPREELIAWTGTRPNPPTLKWLCEHEKHCRIFRIYRTS